MQRRGPGARFEGDDVAPGAQTRKGASPHADDGEDDVDDGRERELEAAREDRIYHGSLTRVGFTTGTVRPATQRAL
ncbi:hypothetical protein, partial [Halarchaeum acidiphilum]|uniref:hypothetical protein n=1 Tax=Halarchaeum acidiphilum TaxID=489138 RepID=UPI001F468101